MSDSEDDSEVREVRGQAEAEAAQTTALVPVPRTRADITYEHDDDEDDIDGDDDSGANPVDLGFLEEADPRMLIAARFPSKVGGKPVRIEIHIHIPIDLFEFFSPGVS